ncbi:uncharacterized protein isoform X2 [Danio rerio]|uniref:Uncharacterized protein isoform X2 n=4 Tax=Danio rerio TaxID=7955 RepID=A0AC58IKR5_DANRE
MFVSVRKMVSIFESKKQPRPLSLPPCVSNEQTQKEKTKHPAETATKPHPSTPSPAPSAVIRRPHLHGGGAGSGNVTLRDTNGVRKLRDSWPIGKLDCYPRAGRLVVSMATREPISSKHLPQTVSRSKLRDKPADLRMSTSKHAVSSETGTDTATPPVGQSQTLHSKNSPRSGPSASSCRSTVCDQKWSSLASSVRADRGGTLFHKHRPRPSDATLLSLLLFFHSGSNSSMIAIDNKIEQAMDLVKSHLMLAVREEVEVLREQIKELSERNAQLERENYILRALKDRD